MPRKGTLYLVWREPHSRAQYKIGELSFDGFLYRFKYSSAEGLSLAEAHGFIAPAALPSFPDTEKSYESPELFSTFAHRLPDPKRPDYAKVLEAYDLSPRSHPFEILRETRGRLATDAFSFEEAPVVTEAGRAITCWVAGWRFYDGDRVLSGLHPGTRLDLRRDTSNPYDRHAVAVFSPSGAMLGFVPVFHSDLVFGALSKGRRVDASIVELRLPPAESSERARMRIEISFGTDEANVREIILDKLRSGQLPRSFPPATHLSTLEGNEPIIIGGAIEHRCSACGRPVNEPDMLSIEFRYPVSGSVYFHYRCFELWNELRSQRRPRQPRRSTNQ
jgi:hypothetical protein